MSLYYVNLACRNLIRDRDYREAMRKDPAAALAGFDLTDEERAALIGGDIEALHAAGANHFLMGFLARFEVCGLNPMTYNVRMRALASKPVRPA